MNIVEGDHHPEQWILLCHKLPIDMPTRAVYCVYSFGTYLKYVVETPQKTKYFCPVDATKMLGCLLALTWTPAHAHDTVCQRDPAHQP
jgi:hypothetical protein